MPFRLEECEWARDHYAALCAALGLRHKRLLASRFVDLDASLERMKQWDESGDLGQSRFEHVKGEGGSGITLMREPAARKVLAEGLSFRCEGNAAGPAPRVALAFRDQDTAVDTAAFGSALAELLSSPA